MIHPNYQQVFQITLLTKNVHSIGAKIWNPISILNKQYLFQKFKNKYF